MENYQAEIDLARRARDANLRADCGAYYGKPPQIGMLREIMLDCSSYAVEGLLFQGWVHETGSGVAEEYRVKGVPGLQIIIKNGLVASIYRR